MTVHAVAGYAILILLLFRFFWGFIGPKYSLFKDFPTGINNVKNFIKNIFSQKQNYIGHNPLASYLMIAILVCTFFIIITGILTFGIQESKGIFSHLNHTFLKDLELFEELHEFFANFLYLLVASHLFGLIVELLGVNYGLFFGDYSYGDNLGSKIYGVPYVIGFNWVLLIIATGSVSDKLIKGRKIYKIIFASFLMVLIDLLMEKSAPKLDFWEFVISPVPFSNYLWWFIFSLCFQYIFSSSWTVQIVNFTGYLSVYGYRPF